MGPEKTQLPPTSGESAPLRSGVGSDGGDTSLSEAVAILRKRRWILILAAVLGASYGCYKAFTQPKLFEASSLIQVNNGAANAYKVSASSDFGDDSQTKMNTEVLILRSDTLMANVAHDLHLEKNADFLGLPGPPAHPLSLDDPSVRAGVIGTLQGNLQVALVPRTQLIRISYSSLNPKLSADIVNQVVGDYIQRSFRAPEEQTAMASNSLSDQLDNLKTKVERSQEEMMELQRKLGVLGYDSTHNQLQSSLEGLLAADATAKVARITAESRYRMIAGMDPNTIEGSIETTPGTAPGELNLLRGQLATAKASYSQLAATLGANNPRMKSLRDQMGELAKEIDTEQSRLQLQSKETYLAAKAAEDKTEQELEARKKEAYNQGNDLVRYTLLQREYEQNRTLYDGLQQRLETARVEAGLDALEVDRVDIAVPPVSPTLRPPSQIIVTTTLFFLLGGIVIAFIVESLDTGLHNIQEIEAMMEAEASAPWN